MDFEVGRLLDALEASGEADNTAILLHGDHGWSLGERAEWRKNSNWENAVRTPLMVAVPWMPDTAGTRTSAFAELVDIMPTLAELAGVATPSTKLADRKSPLEGVSLVPALTGNKQRPVGRTTQNSVLHSCPGSMYEHAQHQSVHQLLPLPRRICERCSLFSVSSLSERHGRAMGEEWGGP